MISKKGKREGGLESLSVQKTTIEKINTQIAENSMKSELDDEGEGELLSKRRGHERGKMVAERSAKHFKAQTQKDKKRKEKQSSNESKKDRTNTSTFSPSKKLKVENQKNHKSSDRVEYSELERKFDQTLRQERHKAPDSYSLHITEKTPRSPHSREIDNRLSESATPNQSQNDPGSAFVDPLVDVDLSESYYHDELSKSISIYFEIFARTSSL